MVELLNSSELATRKQTNDFEEDFDFLGVSSA